MQLNFKSTAFWLSLIGAVLVLSIGIILYLHNSGGTMAVIYQGNEEIYRIDLSKVQEETEFSISSDLGNNTVTIAPGRIGMTEADCPDGLCVKQGFITTSGVPIVCLPHEIYIAIEDEK